MGWAIEMSKSSRDNGKNSIHLSRGLICLSSILLEIMILVMKLRTKYGTKCLEFVTTLFFMKMFFLCLNTQGGPGAKPVLLQDEQIDWTLEELKKNDKARWTLCFYASASLVNGRGYFD